MLGNGRFLTLGVLMTDDTRKLTPTQARHILTSRFDEVAAIRRYDPRSDPSLSTEDAAICIAAELVLLLELKGVRDDG